MFGSFITIKYIPPFTNFPKRYLLTVFEDLRTAWLISKSEMPRGIFGTLSKTRHQRCAFRVPLTRFLKVSLVHHAHHLAVYTFRFLLSFPEHALPPPKKATGRSRSFSLAPPLVFLSYLVPSHLLISVPNRNHQWASLDASIFAVAVPQTHLADAHFVDHQIFDGHIIFRILDSRSCLAVSPQNIICSFYGLNSTSACFHLYCTLGNRRLLVS
jgi:hypothetical protein